MNRTLNKEIRKALIDKEMTQREFSRSIDIEPSYFSMIMGGHQRPSVDVALKICVALFGESDETNSRAIQMARKPQ